MRTTDRLAALVLAAGYSSRAPGFKPLLPLGGATAVENAIDCFRRAGVADITVVTGHRASDLAQVLDRLPVRQIFNPGYEAGMFSSVHTGLKSLRPDLDAFFLLPADMPMVASHTVRLLARAYKKTGAPVIYPVFRGLRGHPPLISTRLLPAIFAGDGEQGGLRSILARYDHAANELSVLDEGVLLDIDTPSDYLDITERCRHSPTPTVCDALMKSLNLPETVIRHGAMVAAVAGRMATRLNESSLKLDTGLIIASGLLHDLAKGRPDHARVAARIIKGLGYPRVAAVVGLHTDIAFAEGQSLDEAAVIYLADKLVDRDRIVSIDERFSCAQTRFAEDAAAQAALHTRLAAAQAIARQVELTLGLRLPEVIAGNELVANLQEGRR